MNSNVDGNDCQRNSRDTSSLSFPTAIGFFTNLAASLYSSLGFASTLNTSDLVPRNQAQSEMPNEIEVVELSDLCTADQPLVAIELQTSAETNLEQKRGQFLLPSGSKSPKEFGQFDMVTDCLDHHFVDGSGKSLTFSQVNYKFFPQLLWQIFKKVIVVSFSFIFLLDEKRLAQEGSARVEYFGERSSRYVCVWHACNLICYIFSERNLKLLKLQFVFLS